MDSKKEGMAKLQAYFSHFMFPVMTIYDNLNRPHNYQFSVSLVDDATDWKRDYIVVYYKLINPDDYWIKNNIEFPQRAHEFFKSICQSLTSAPILCSWDHRS